ncbi:hypothetical protein AX15_000274 [Amanita polypyramis BW_CC]|nr:hypothetical protein AX15_000274 [Amanita polypyramis BW_CC]
MLFFIAFRLVSSIGAFLYPGYASYKTLSQRPASEEELERWLMYWSVLGCIVGIEYIAEWLVSWIPFYYMIKTIFLLYLALPQTRGSSYIYVNHLSPFFRSHESQIDATLASLRARIYTFVQSRFRALWEHVSSTMGQQQSSTFSREMDAGVPPTLHDPASGPAQLVSSLWTSYGPGIITSGMALLRQATVGTTNARIEQRTDLNTPPESRTGSVRGESQQVLLERKRRLEAELAALSQQASEPISMPNASPAIAFPGRSSDSDVRRRERRNSNASGGRFEEIEVPSDIEGYDVGQDADSEAVPPPATRTSWFGWGGGSSKGDYESVKTE